MADKFTFFRSFYEAIQDHDAETFKEELTAVFNYVFEDEEADPQKLSPNARTFYVMAKPVIDKSIMRAEAGAKGGESTRQKQKKKPQQTTAKKKDKPEPEPKPETKKEPDKPAEKPKKEEPETGNPNLDSMSITELEKMFKDKEVADTLLVWLRGRAQESTLSYAVITDEIDRAKKAEKELGSKKCIDTIKASYGYKRIAWDKLTKKKASNSRSPNTNSNEDDVWMRVAKGEDFI